MVKDKVDPVQDEKLASFVVDSHMRSHPDKVCTLHSDKVSLQLAMPPISMSYYSRFANACCLHTSMSVYSLLTTAN